MPIFKGTGSATVPVAPSGVPPDGIADGMAALCKESGATPDTAGGTPALPFQSDDSFENFQKILASVLKWAYSGNQLEIRASFIMKHKALQGENCQWILILASGVVLLVVAFYYCLAPQSSSSTAQNAKSTNTPALVQNAPAMQLKRPEKVEVMKTLLEQDREEIRFYQDKLFNVSFAFSATLLGMVAFALKTTGRDSLFRRFLGASCFIFCVFYLLFGHFANDAIVQNHKDLVGIQYALDLSQTNAYLTNGQVIYGTEKPGSMKYAHIYWLAIFNIMLAVASAVVLKYAPKVEGDAG